MGYSEAGKYMDVLSHIFNHYSRCNKFINAAMLETIKQHDIFNKPVSGHYKSINDILFHILDVDVSWIHDLREIIHSKIYEEEIFKTYDENSYENPYKNVSDFERDRMRLDDLLIEFTAGLSARELEKTILYKNTKTKRAWEVLIHTFNHQTHHRGQISQILDENGIANDFSNMIRIEI
ncbi:MAG: hypothetical protein LBK40_00645 [Spirochaetaceae bacterium]|jgi:uncharacterized damage-inducible protein DinB|nr:hypothetical protein [Spirochaetaceae bacterium]